MNYSRTRVIRFVSIFVACLLQVAMFSISSQADGYSVRFLMNDPVTSKPARAGQGWAILNQVNQETHAQTRQETDANGVVSFTFDPKYQYYLDAYLNGNNSAQVAIEYVVTAQADGSTQVLSSSGDPVAKDSNGSWLITFSSKRIASAGDPWKLMPPAPFHNPEANLMLLPNGKVMVISKNDFSWWLLSPDSKGDYVNGSWQRAAQPPSTFKPENFNSYVLHSGNLYFFGSEQNHIVPGAPPPSDDVLMYDVSHDAWSMKPSPNAETSFGGNPSVELPNGILMTTREQAYMPPALMFDEASTSWTRGAPCCSQSESGFTLMQNDKVLHIDTGGCGPQGAQNVIGLYNLTSTQVFDPSTNSWMPSGNTPDPLSCLEIGPAVSLPTGDVIATGASGHNALYKLSTGTWVKVPDFPTLQNGLQLAATDNYMAVLPSGNALTVAGVILHNIVDGHFKFGVLGPDKYFLYNLSTNTWTAVPDDPMAPALSQAPRNSGMVVLPTGQLLVADGDGFGVYSDGGAPKTEWAPQINKISSTTITARSTQSISGFQLAGLSQGVQWGDEQEDPTNFPLLRIQNVSSGNVFYATTSNFSSTSIAPMSPSSFDFMFGPEVENGPARLTVIANGIASKPIDVQISGGSNAVTTAMPVNKTQTISEPPSPAAAKTISNRQIAITCIKGKLTKRVLGSNPSCPLGYKKK